MLDDRTATMSARQYGASAERRVLWPTENNRWAWDAVLGESHAELHIWAGGVHAFDLLAPDTLVAIASYTARENWLRRILTAGGHASPPRANSRGVKREKVQNGAV
jgi:hypothetical protein